MGVTISLPLGIVAARRPRWEHVSLLAANIVQTIPGLALLAIMVFLWGQIGWLPATIALILYSILPILRNTIVGLKGIDPAIIEAAQGVGMDSWQMLRMVQLPLALPTIIAGIRTASVWVVGAATIAQPVGATSLGNYIFVGLQTSNAVSLVFGCLLSAGLALALDGLLHSLERTVTLQHRGRLLWTGAGLAFVAFIPVLLPRIVVRASGNTVVHLEQADQTLTARYIVAGKAFTEQYIWAQAMRRRLESQGLDVEVRDGMGSATVFQALEQGQIDCYVDYTGTIWSNYMHRRDIAAPVEMLIDVACYLKQERQIYCLGALGFSNDYAFATTRELAERHGLKSLDDLARISTQLVGGTDIEFFDRPEWDAVRRSYGLDFGRKVTMDPTLMYGAVSAGQLDVIVAFNTDSRLQRYDLVVLEDPRLALPPYDAVLLVSARMIRDPRAMAALRPLLQSVTSARMRRLNGMVDLDGRTATEAAEVLLKAVEP